MLCLRRKVGERIQAGEIDIYVIRVTADGNVVLGFEAPREIKILRSELVAMEASQGENDDQAA